MAFLRPRVTKSTGHWSSTTSRRLPPTPLWASSSIEMTSTGKNGIPPGELHTSRAAFNRLGTRDTWERERETLNSPPTLYFPTIYVFLIFLFKRKEFWGGDHYYLPRPTGKFHNLVMPISPVIWLLRSGIYKRKKKVTLFLLFRYIIK